jgi:hypothetical protein
MTKLQPFQQRAVSELKDLRAKIFALDRFLQTPDSVTLPMFDRSLLMTQMSHMEAYADVLQRRVDNFLGTKFYTCHKRVKARPMKRGEYNNLRGWEVPKNEDPQDDGYFIEYLDGGEPNHPAFPNYISWSPKDVFERGYSEDTV